MNTVINNILSNDDELFNRVRAYGPGDGINRLMVTVEDSSSISDYGLRETTQSFPDAVDISDLTTQATEYLNSVKEPKQDVSVTYYFSTNSELEELTFGLEVITFGGDDVTYYSVNKVNEVKRGDTVRVSSRDLGTTFTGVVQEIDWQPGQVTFLLGQPAYNILEVITGPERSERRISAALGLPTPLGFTGFPSNPGITVRVNPYTNSRAVGVEVYADTSPLTTVSKDKLVAKGSETTFHFPDLETGQTFYFKARSYDNQGNVSELTDEIQVKSGFVTGAPRLLYSGTAGLTTSVTGIAPPYELTGSSSVVSSIDTNVTIPVGKKYVITTGLLDFFVGTKSFSGRIDFGPKDYFISSYNAGFFPHGIIGVDCVTSLSAGDYPNLNAKLSAVINSVSGITPTSGVTLTIELSYQVYEVDA